MDVGVGGSPQAGLGSGGGWVGAIDRRLFPRVAAYVARLPMGLTSHPQCRARASLVGGLLAAWRVPPIPEGALPPALDDLLSWGPGRDWIPEPLAIAAQLALADRLGLDERELAAALRGVPARLLAGRGWRALLATPSPSTVLLGASARWSSFHVGSLLSAEPTGRRSCTAGLFFPSSLFDRPALAMLVAGFGLALEVSGAERPHVELSRFGDTYATFAAGWSGG